MPIIAWNILKHGIALYWRVSPLAILLYDTVFSYVHEILLDHNFRFSQLVTGTDYHKV